MPAGIGSESPAMETRVFPEHCARCPRLWAREQMTSAVFSDRALALRSNQRSQPVLGGMAGMGH